LILSLDTASKNCSVSISKDGEVLSEYNFISDNTLSSRIINIIDFVLKGLNLKMKDIKNFAITVGPGIFTGIRVGMATLKGLTFLTDVKYVPIDNLKATAYKLCKDKDKTIISILDAKREQVYLAGYEYEKKGKSLNSLLEPVLIDVNKISDILEIEKDYLFVGNGVKNYKDELKTVFTNSNFYFKPYFLASEIAKIARNDIENGYYETDIEKLNPLYIKRTDAEVNYERDNKTGR
jgi:tRNA threonylcarbamoyl adenosine modification protein YeaZ